MSMYTIVSETELREPVMVCALSGWVDAASAATDAAAHLAGESPVVAYFDPDELFDYRSSRPVLDIVEGITQKVAWPEVTIRGARAGDRDALVMTGTEPDLRWRAFASDIVEISHQLGVSLHITLGAVPAAVPHTLPCPVMTTASSSEHLDKNARVPPALRVPSAAVSIVDQALHRSGIPTVGYFAQIPHYVTGPYYDGVITLLGRVEARLGVELPLGDLREQSGLQRKQLDEVVAGRPDAKEYVERLEGLAAQENLPSGDELAAEIERYFRGQDPGGPGPFTDGPT